MFLGDMHWEMCIRNLSIPWLLSETHTALHGQRLKLSAGVESGTHRPFPFLIRLTSFELRLSSELWLFPNASPSPNTILLSCLLAPTSTASPGRFALSSGLLSVFTRLLPLESASSCRISLALERLIRPPSKGLNKSLGTLSPRCPIGRV